MRANYTTFSIITMALLFTLCTSEEEAEFDQHFTLTQEELFSAPGSLSNAWGDADNDGDFDLFVGFRIGTPNRFYRNDNGTFIDIASEMDMADTAEVRAASWGDYNNDGYLDLYVGYTRPPGKRNQLYRNNGDGSGFTNVAAQVGLDISVNIRQVSWIDFDNDGDLDLAIAVRNAENRLYRNDGETFVDVAPEMGIDDARRTVGAVWFDYDMDGDLDQYVTNQNGDQNGMFRNDGSHFTDVAVELNLDAGGRPLNDTNYGGIRPSLADYDNDGDIDIAIINYGPNALFRNNGGGPFTDVGTETGLAIDSRYDTGTWGDFDNDGLIDLYINGTIGRDVAYRDYLFRNTGTGFEDITPDIILDLIADHGATWVDFDNDGDLDLSLAGSGVTEGLMGMHYIVTNVMMKDQSNRSFKVLLLDHNGHFTRAGAEVRIYRADTQTLLGTRLVDTGSGYNSQDAISLHFGLKVLENIDIEVTSMTQDGRISDWIRDLNPANYSGENFEIRVDNSGKIVK